MDWRREFKSWRIVQRLVRLGALQRLTGDQLKALGVDVDGAQERS